MSRYDNKDPAMFTVWWVNEAKDADMDCGSFTTQEDAEAALPDLFAWLINECANAEQEASIRAGSFHLEHPETEDGERGETEPMDWQEDE